VVGVWAAALVLAAGGYLTGVASATQDLPTEDSVDVGFLQDMIVHHEQAVTLAMIVLTRATVPAVREVAHDIAESQQQEAGMMAGWLQQWGLPTSTPHHARQRGSADSRASDHRPGASACPPQGLRGHQSLLRSGSSAVASGRASPARAVRSAVIWSTRFK